MRDIIGMMEPPPPKKKKPNKQKNKRLYRGHESDIVAVVSLWVMFIDYDFWHADSEGEEMADLSHYHCCSYVTDMYLHVTPARHLNDLDGFIGTGSNVACNHGVVVGKWEFRSDPITSLLHIGHRSLWGRCPKG